MPITTQWGNRKVLEVSKVEQRSIEDARDAMHHAVIVVLMANGINYMDIDLSEAAESLALEGYLNL